MLSDALAGLDVAGSRLVRCATCCLVPIHSRIGARKEALANAPDHLGQDTQIFAGSFSGERG